MNEEWKDIKGYEGLYQVSSLGRVKNLERYVKARDNSLRKNKEKILSFFINKNGYQEATLSKNSKKRLHRVNRLVAEAFTTWLKYVGLSFMGACALWVLLAIKPDPGFNDRFNECLQKHDLNYCNEVVK